MISYREMSVDDIPAGLELCRHAGWNQLEEDWKLFLQQNTHGSCVAVDDNDKVVGTAATIRYDGKFSWIGMVLVDPSKKRMGIGTQLLDNALKILRDDKCVRLDATPAGREIYLKIGFHDEYRISRMINRSLRPSSAPHDQVFAVSEQDLPEIAILDRKIFGADRLRVLEWLYRNAPQLAFVLRKENKITGYCFGRNGFNHMQIGPLVANHVQDAIKLISAALENCVGRSVVVDAMLFDAAWIAYLVEAGFAEERQFIRMFRGINESRGIPTLQYAIMGPEFG